MVSGWAPALQGLFILSLVGGALGGLLLLNTPSSIFARLVPWLVLFATTVFAWGSFFRKPGANRPTWAGAGVAQFLIAIYGGYFGGGIGFLMLAALTMAGMATRNAGATKNVLAGVMNASAVALFVLSPRCTGCRRWCWARARWWVAWPVPGPAPGQRTLLRMAIVALGVALTIGLFLKA
jgi:uncharacterized membrane protein YfcA